MLTFFSFQCFGFFFLSSLRFHSISDARQQLHSVERQAAQFAEDADRAKAQRAEAERDLAELKADIEHQDRGECKFLGQHVFIVNRIPFVVFTRYLTSRCLYLFINKNITIRRAP
jgi:hypothetical protein